MPSPTQRITVEVGLRTQLSPAHMQTRTSGLQIFSSVSPTGPGSQDLCLTSSRCEQLPVLHLVQSLNF